MKTTNKFLMAFAVFAMLFCTPIIAQDDAPAGPQYVTVTTMHWNMDNDDFDNDEWIATEKEFLEKVTNKNEHILAASYYTHRITDDNTELLYVQAYASWNAIDLAADRNAELIKEAWPDEDARDAFFEKQNSYYSVHHSDEIYSTMPGAKALQGVDKDMIMYVRTSHFAYPEDGSQDEFMETYTAYYENVTHKNEYIKGYYPNAHAYGADRTVFVEAIFLDSMADLDEMFKRDGELYKEHWKDEAARKEMDEKGGKYFTGVHSDKIYTFIYGLSK